MMTIRRSAGVAGLLVTLLFSATAQAGPFRMLLESDEDRADDFEVFGLSYPTFDDLLDHNADLDGFGGLNIGPQFSIGGLAYDGQYRLLVERDTDAETGSEVAFATFETYEDLLSGNVTEQGFTQLNIGANFGVGGFAYDGQYRLLVESNEDRLGGSEIALASFASFDDLVDSQIASQGFSQLNVGAGFNVTGFAFDDAYRLVLESITDRATNEVFGLSFADFDDLLSSTFLPGASGFTPLNVGPNFSSAGLAFEFEDVVNEVPEPSSLSLLFGSAMLLVLRRRRYR